MVLPGSAAAPGLLVAMVTGRLASGRGAGKSPAAGLTPPLRRCRTPCELHREPVRCLRGPSIQRAARSNCRSDVAARAFAAGLARATSREAKGHRPSMGTQKKRGPISHVINGPKYQGRLAGQPAAACAKPAGGPGRGGPVKPVLAGLCVAVAAQPPGPHLWKISRIYAANRMRWTQPCMTFAWPLAKVTMETPSVTISSHSSVCSTPRISGWPVR
jgi:hypothetical protein